MKILSMHRNLFKKARAKIISYRQWLYVRIDYGKYALNLSFFRAIAGRLSCQNKGSLLIVSGRGMNVLWAQIWSIFSLALRIHGYRGLVVTSRSSKHLNRYYRLLNLELIYYEDIVKDLPATLPGEIKEAVKQASSVQDYRNISYKDMPIGEIALSTYTRYHGTGVIDLGKTEVVKGIQEWMNILCQAKEAAEHIYQKYNVKIIFVAEIFFEEYGAFYYMALFRDLNIIKFTGTVRDNAFIFQHLNKSNDRLHHASVSNSLWARIKDAPFTGKMEAELEQNFLDRYGNKWHRSKRNFPNTRIIPVQQARKELDIKLDRKVAVIYSHILYDSLFFFGTDLFEDYAQCLIETVRAAFQNPNVDWLVKVHPSNLWRGELNTILKGKYEEERLLYKEFGQFPPHVKIVKADTGISPYTWFQLADYGITVRGTSGLEMAALGKTVITAGTGRYEGNGFTIDPKDKDEYIKLLKNIQDIPSLTPQQVALAKRYAHAVFVLKPFTFTSLAPQKRTGVKKVLASDDLIYIPKKFSGNKLPCDLQAFSRWALDKDNLELVPGPENLR